MRSKREYESKTFCCAHIGISAFLLLTTKESKRDKQGHELNSNLSSVSEDV